jgi:hypothetical protein
MLPPPYTPETILHTDGIAYAVLDCAKLDFSGRDVKFGKKTKPTLVRIAKKGEVIITQPGTVEESRIEATGGELVFTNYLPGDVEDVFIPRDAHGNPNGREILSERYRMIGGNILGEGGLFQPRNAPFKLLHEAITEPTCIKDAWGPGNHQFLGKGATLKLDGTRVTGIDKAAFDETWSITNARGQIRGTRAGKSPAR